MITVYEDSLMFVQSYTTRGIRLAIWMSYTMVMCKYIQTSASYSKPHASWVHPNFLLPIKVLESKNKHAMRSYVALRIANYTRSMHFMFAKPNNTKV